MPLEPLANEAIQVHSILYVLARNKRYNEYNKTDDRLLTFVARISNGFVAVTNLVSNQLTDYTELSETASCTWLIGIGVY